MAIKKKIDLVVLILQLLQEKDSVNLQSIAQAAGLDAQAAADRRAIQRAFAYLIKQGSIVPQGEARARIYHLKNRLSYFPHSSIYHPFQIREEGTVYSVEQKFKNISLSEQSRELLAFLSTRNHREKIIEYNQDFLRSYIPNQTFYLDAALREQLHVAGKAEAIERPAGTYARIILNRLLIDLSWNSSRLEGNTYSLIETQRLIELSESAPGKDAIEAQMILNHKDAIEYIVDSVEETSISAYEIYNIHALLSRYLLVNRLGSGRVRKIIVDVSGTSYSPLKNPHVLQECFDLLVEKLNLIQDPFEQSFFALAHIAYLQAFEDVNKRTARLVANIPFIKKNLRPLSFIDVNQDDYVFALLGVYEKNDLSLLRDLYAWAYTRSASRYSGVQQFLGEASLFQFRHSKYIEKITRMIVLEKIPGNQIVSRIKQLISELNLSQADSVRLLEIIETEIMGLYEGSIAQFKISPSAFEIWKRLQ